jgi:hypothetical protein
LVVPDFEKKDPDVLAARRTVVTRMHIPVGMPNATLSASGDTSQCIGACLLVVKSTGNEGRQLHEARCNGIADAGLN